MSPKVAAMFSAMLILFPLGYVVCSFNGAPMVPQSPDKKYDQCVRDTTYMRYHHMDLLWELRDRAVRLGDYDDIGIHTCRQCHKSREKFCNRCHDAVNLSPDCFGCHYYPEPFQSDGEKDK